MQTTGAGKSGFQSGVEQRGHLVSFQDTLGMCHADVLKEFLGTGAGPFGKQTLKMKWTKVHFFCNGFQAGLFPEMLTDVGDSCFHPVIIDNLLLFHSCSFISLASTNVGRDRKRTMLNSN